MNSSSSLTGVHLRTYQTIFQHPVSHNLEWRAVRALLGHLAQVAEEPNGNLKVTRNAQILVLHPPQTKDVAEIEEVMALRHFLERSEVAVAAPSAAARWLLVINHHEARIFHSPMQGSVPTQILPHAEYFRHAPHSKEFSRGQEKPDPNSFFEPVAKMLASAGQILVFGTGTGMGSEMEQFATWAQQHHPLLAERIIGKVVVDESHLTEGQLLAKARDFYAKLPRASLAATSAAALSS